MIDKGLIGKELESRSILVERGPLRFFANVIGETNPVYADEAAAKAAGHRALPVPPTYLFCLQHQANESQSVAKIANLDMGRVLHGEQQFAYHSMAYAGDTLTFEGRIVDVYDKKGGALDFLVTETRVSNQDGKHTADLRGVVVQRNG
jgi:acyl dehydratase